MKRCVPQWSRKRHPVADTTLLVFSYDDDDAHLIRMRKELFTIFIFLALRMATPHQSLFSTFTVTVVGFRFSFILPCDHNNSRISYTTTEGRFNHRRTRRNPLHHYVHIIEHREYRGDNILGCNWGLDWMIQLLFVCGGSFLPWSNNKHNGGIFIVPCPVWTPCESRESEDMPLNESVGAIAQCRGEEEKVCWVVVLGSTYPCAAEGLITTIWKPISAWAKKS